MNSQIHPLQDKAHSLVTALYADLRLPSRAAIAAYSNGRYPTLEEILDTLNAYEDVDLVKKFVSLNAAFICSAKEKIEESKKPKPAPINVDDIPLGAFMSSEFSVVNAYDCIKKIPLKDIEIALSEALSKVCKEHLLVEITTTNGAGRSVELSAKIEPKHYLSQWEDEEKDPASPAI